MTVTPPGLSARKAAWSPAIGIPFVLDVAELSDDVEGFGGQESGGDFGERAYKYFLRRHALPAQAARVRAEFDAGHIETFGGALHETAVAAAEVNELP